MFSSLGNLTSSYRHSSTNLWVVLFHVEGNILFRVLPFCMINCLLLALVDHLRKKENVGFSPTGHGLLTLLVSFLVINKVNLAYERFREARTHAGDAFLLLRELNQLAICFSGAHKDSSSENKDYNDKVQLWRSEHVVNSIRLLDCTKFVIQNEGIAKYFARNKQKHVKDHSEMTDPLTVVQCMRMHLYNGDVHLELLERVSLVNKLDSFVESYRQLLELASTPLPFALVQMGRAFLFLWTFSMPLVLLQGPFTDLWTAMVFLFFLTYGFVGLELVSMKLTSPFGDGIHDIQLTNLRDVSSWCAAIVAILQFKSCQSRACYTLPLK